VWWTSVLDAGAGEVVYVVSVHEGVYIEESKEYVYSHIQA